MKAEKMVCSFRLIEIVLALSTLFFCDAFFATPWGSGCAHCSCNTKQSTHEQLRQSSSILRMGISPISAADGCLSPKFAVNVAKKTSPSVAMVIPRGIRNSTARGTAFVIDLAGSETDAELGTYLLTSAHVVPPGWSIAVSFPNSERLPDRDDVSNVNEVNATVVHRDTALDLALMRIPSTQHESLPIRDSKEEVDVGSILLACGYPRGLTVVDETASRPPTLSPPALTCGIACGIARGFPDVPPAFLSGPQFANGTNLATYVVTDAALAPGMSGGPLMDIDGTVCGINTLLRTDMGGLGNYAVSAKTIRLFLREYADSVSADRISNEEALDPISFRLWLYNDNFNKKERVSKILRNVAKVDGDIAATKIMMEAHRKGKGLVREFSGQDKIEANEMLVSLRDEDILVEIESIWSN